MDFNRFNTNRRSFKIMKNMTGKAKKIENCDNENFYSVALPKNVPYKACQILHIPLSGLNIQQDLIRTSGPPKIRVPQKKVVVDTEQCKEFCTIRRPRIVQRSTSLSASRFHPCHLLF